MTFLIFIIATLPGCGDQEKSNELESPAVASELQQRLYFGGDIITMEGSEPSYVETVMVRDGKIVCAGKRYAADNDFPEQPLRSICRAKP